jgi:hypothetical protein
VPKPRVFFRLDDYTASALAAARNMHEQLFHAVGATEIGHLPYAEGAGHIMGTPGWERMPGLGGDRDGPKPRPSQSVVRRRIAVSDIGYGEPDPDHCGACAADSRAIKIALKQ